MWTRVIYTTITPMAVLIIYDGWEQLRSWNVVTVIVGPLLAIFLSHVFGAALGSRVALGRPLTRQEHRTVFAMSADFYSSPSAARHLGDTRRCRCLYTRIIEVIVLTGVLSLGVWGGVAGGRAGLTGWPLLVPIDYGLFVGAIIWILQALLQPGDNPFPPLRCRVRCSVTRQVGLSWL